MSETLCVFPSPRENGERVAEDRKSEAGEALSQYSQMPLTRLA